MEEDWSSGEPDARPGGGEWKRRLDREERGYRSSDIPSVNPCA